MTHDGHFLDACKEKKTFGVGCCNMKIRYHLFSLVYFESVIEKSRSLKVKFRLSCRAIDSCILRWEDTLVFGTVECILRSSELKALRESENVFTVHETRIQIGRKDIKIKNKSDIYFYTMLVLRSLTLISSC